MLKDIAKDPKKISVYGIEWNEQTKNDMKKELLNMPTVQMARSQQKQTPTPEPKKCLWRSARTKEGLLYYWNIHTKQSTWDKPADFVEEEQKDNTKKVSSKSKGGDDKESIGVPIIKKSRIVFNNVKRDSNTDQVPVTKG